MRARGSAASFDGICVSPMPRPGYFGVGEGAGAAYADLAEATRAPATISDRSVYRTGCFIRSGNRLRDGSGVNAGDLRAEESKADRRVPGDRVVTDTGPTANCGRRTDRDRRQQRASG